jgi:hypothetical protein
MTLKNSSERYTVGVDLGQSVDPTAVAIVRTVRAGAADPIFQVGHLERVPLNTPYPGVISHVARIMSKPILRDNAELVIDYTGVGRPVFDMFQAKGLSPIGVTITGGDSISRDGMIWRVPKAQLISRVQALLHDGRLKIHKDIADAPALIAELQDFRADVTDTGHWRFNAREGKHDDLVLALAIALWRAHGDMVSGAALFELARREALGTGSDRPEQIQPTYAPGSIEWAAQQASSEASNG